MEFIIGAVSGVLVGGIITLITLSAVMCGGNMEHKNIGFTVIIAPNGKAYILCIADEGRNPMLEAILGTEYTAHPCQGIPIADTITALASTDESRPYNRWASEICCKDLYGYVVLMPVEEKRFVLYEYDRAFVFQHVVNAEIKMRKNTDGEVYGENQA